MAGFHRHILYKETVHHYIRTHQTDFLIESPVYDDLTCADNDFPRYAALRRNNHLGAESNEIAMDIAVDDNRFSEDMEIVADRVVNCYIFTGDECIFPDTLID